MLYHLLYPLSKHFFIFNVTKYITFRAGCAFFTSFILVFCFWRPLIKKLHKLQIKETIDMYGHLHLEALHKNKKGTPTMGGALIIFAIFFSSLLWARLDNLLVWAVLFTMVALAALGLADDLLKIKKGKGLNRLQKLFWQSAVGLVLGVFIFFYKDIEPTWSLPFFKNFVLNIGYFYIFWAALLIAATSNAVNFTDGLDGLAIGSLIINALIFSLLAYLAGHIKFADYLFIPYIKDAGELMVITISLVGAGLAFLWFNSYPAQVFMGDIGALALGGVIGAVALIIKKEFILFLSGGLFVAEALSVILQIFSVKLRKKRIFKAAPIHHHFQIKGWPEPKIIVRFWIVTIICAFLALLTLKLR
ncbi:MAG: phospho-N-acetylmuramoyl-pentapeptide-transferase [Candidatus Omnitrophica bacterium]|nr:phospho-N-acetylmuramoyl-pentapeptide-transferase [Candidatus Omnitrophota bacterium]MCF7891696.1 phospho-N-acetylmuramoyl-pentapeptide-transferase [Candidatus Omnitrophota bacterium]MCF7897872.1 phospho-N-acetylmuramoyl-pentapeptide-transferase [Candidatus Omnitrophota bacterium]MCF7909124.1 phospho-N-acetylmuramoyl-pentapeptide-transferase [Candidatus Omnitrophota bacterium]